MPLKQQFAMPDHELSADAEEGFRDLHELFRAADPSSQPTRRCRRYILEFRDGDPVFRDANSGLAQPRSEIELALAQVFDEVLNNDIVPQKLAKAFPGSSIEPGHY
jgi:hypothetical protein